MYDTRVYKARRKARIESDPEFRLREQQRYRERYQRKKAEKHQIENPTNAVVAPEDTALPSSDTVLVSLPDVQSTVKPPSILTPRVSPSPLPSPIEFHSVLGGNIHEDSPKRAIEEEEEFLQTALIDTQSLTAISTELHTVAIKLPQNMAVLVVPVNLTSVTGDDSMQLQQIGRRVAIIRGQMTNVAEFQVLPPMCAEDQPNVDTDIRQIVTNGDVSNSGPMIQITPQIAEEEEEPEMDIVEDMVQAPPDLSPDLPIEPLVAMPKPQPIPIPPPEKTSPKTPPGTLSPTEIPPPPLLTHKTHIPIEENPPLPPPPPPVPHPIPVQKQQSLIRPKIEHIKPSEVVPAKKKKLYSYIEAIRCGQCFSEFEDLRELANHQSSVHQMISIRISETALKDNETVGAELELSIEDKIAERLKKSSNSTSQRQRQHKTMATGSRGNRTGETPITSPKSAPKGKTSAKKGANKPPPVLLAEPVEFPEHFKHLVEDEGSSLGQRPPPNKYNSYTIVSASGQFRSEAETTNATSGGTFEQIFTDSSGNQIVVHAESREQLQELLASLENGSLQVVNEEEDVGMGEEDKDLH